MKTYFIVTVGLNNICLTKMLILDLDKDLIEKGGVISSW